MSNNLRTIGSTGMVLCRDHGAYIVGSAAEWLLDPTKTYPGDIDLIVSPSEYSKASRLFSTLGPCTVNKFGGIRSQERVGSFTYDIWPMELGEYFRTLPQGFPQVAYNPVYDVIVRRERTNGS